MIVSKTSEYALRALIYLVSQGPGARLSADQLANAIGAQPPFLAKIVQKLVKAGILDSKRGPSGGVSLAKAAGNVTLWQVISALQGPTFLEGCILGLDTCDPNHPCPLHGDWLVIRRQLLSLLQSKTLQDLGQRVRINGARVQYRRTRESSKSGSDGPKVPKTL
jgi:Rrf2 family protein